MSQPLTLIGTLTNSDTTGATGTLYLQLNTYATVSVAAGGPKGIAANSVVVVPIVNGAIQGTHQVYGNDVLSGATWYAVKFVNSLGKILFVTKWVISDNGSSQFDITSATTYIPPTSQGGSSGNVKGVAVDMPSATITFTVGQLKAMRNDDGPNHNGAGSALTVVPTPAANEVIIPLFWVFTSSAGTAPTAYTPFQLFADNLLPDGLIGSQLQSSNFLPTLSAASIFCGGINFAMGSGSPIADILDYKGKALLFGKPHVNGVLTDGDSSIVVTLTVYYTVVSF